MGDFFGLGLVEVMLIGVVAVLLFGKDLPEMSRKAGKYLGQIRKSMQNIKQEIHSVTSDLTTEVNVLSSPLSDNSPDREETAAPKFVPPPA
jgi:sec-independent protein translocase protein TatA